VLRNESNALCRRCVRSCRQPAGVLLLDCPRFLSLPFKIAEPSFAQLDLFAEKL
jgi:hypothetical protein